VLHNGNELLRGQNTCYNEKKTLLVKIKVKAHFYIPAESRSWEVQFASPSVRHWYSTPGSVMFKWLVWLELPRGAPTNNLKHSFKIMAPLRRKWWVKQGSHHIMWRQDPICCVCRKMN